MKENIRIEKTKIMGGGGSIADMVNSMKFNRRQLKDKRSNFKTKKEDLTGSHLKLQYRKVNIKQLAAIKQKIRERARLNLMVQIVIWLIFTSLLFFLVKKYVFPILF